MSLVSYVLVTGSYNSSNEGGKPWAQKETWLSTVTPGSWAYLSDTEDPRLPAYEVPGTAGGWGPSQRKWLGLLQRLAASKPPFDSDAFFPRGSSWLFVGDDDTFVWTDTLQQRLRAFKRQSDEEAMYLGLPDRELAEMVGLDLGEANSYCMGGAGFLLSRRLAQMLEGKDIQAQCGDLFDHGGHSDIALARCFSRLAGVDACEAFPGMNQKPYPFSDAHHESEALDGEGDYPTCAPISFHWMKPGDMKRLWHMQ